VHKCFDFSFRLSMFICSMFVLLSKSKRPSPRLIFFHAMSMLNVKGHAAKKIKSLVLVSDERGKLVNCSGSIALV